MSMGLPLPEEAGRPWGLHLIVDLYGCTPALIRDEEAIRVFAAKLVDQVAMTAHGAPLVERFALDNPDAAGYSLVQLITTSSITAHFAEGDNTAYIDLFSCKPFDTTAAARFIAGYFGASDYESHVMYRGRRRT